MASKRGVQVELALARLRTRSSDLRTWGPSATLANLVITASACIR
jgi:ATP-dependent Lhr-like helicase